MMQTTRKGFLGKVMAGAVALLALDRVKPVKLQAETAAIPDDGSDLRKTRRLTLEGLSRDALIAGEIGFTSHDNFCWHIRNCAYDPLMAANAVVRGTEGMALQWLIHNVDPGDVFISEIVFTDDDQVKVREYRCQQSRENGRVVSESRRTIYDKTYKISEWTP